MHPRRTVQIPLSYSPRTPESSVFYLTTKDSQSSTAAGSVGSSTVAAFPIPESPR